MKRGSTTGPAGDGGEWNKLVARCASGCGTRPITGRADKSGEWGESVCPDAGLAGPVRTVLQPPGYAENHGISQSIDSGFPSSFSTGKPAPRHAAELTILSHWPNSSPCPAPHAAVRRVPRLPLSPAGPVAGRVPHPDVHLTAGSLHSPLSLARLAVGCGPTCI